MTLRTGTVIAGSEVPVGVGVNSSLRAIIRVDGALHRAILKRLPQDGVLAECFCGMLLRVYGLPCPEPILIRDGDTLAFASLEVDYPNLKQRLCWDERHPEAIKAVLLRTGAAIVCGWQDAPLALAIDEWIANTDRNLHPRRPREIVGAVSRPPARRPPHGRPGVWRPGRERPDPLPSANRRHATEPARHRA